MLTLLFCLRDCFRPRFVLQAEILALRHQLLVLQRSSRGHKLPLGCTDRVLWVWLSRRLWDDWRSALLILRPENRHQPRVVPTENPVLVEPVEFERRQL